MTPPTPSRPVRITAETHLKFPCWQYGPFDPDLPCYWDKFNTQQAEATWFCDSPERPTCTPDDNWEQTKANFAHAQRVVERAHAKPTPTAPDPDNLQSHRALAMIGRTAAPDLPTEPIMTGFSDKKGDPAYWGDAVKDFWAETGMNTDSTDLALIVSWFTKRRLPAPIPVTAPLTASEGEADEFKRSAIFWQTKYADVLTATEATVEGLRAQLTEAKQQWRMSSVCRELTEKLATAEKERDEAIKARDHYSEEVASVCEEMDSLRARLTPSASQSAEMETGPAVAFICQGCKMAVPVNQHCPRCERHFTTPTQ